MAASDPLRSLAVRLMMHPMRAAMLFIRQLNEAFERPAVVRFFSWLDIVIGAVLVLFTCFFALAHYVWDMPVYDENTGQLASEGKTLFILLLLGSGGALIAVMGVVRLRKMRCQV